MTVYNKAFRLNSPPEGRQDNSNQIGHDIVATYSPNGDKIPIPGYHKTVLLPADEVDTVMDMPDGTGLEKQAKNVAYKNLLRAHRDDQATPIHPPSATDWSDEGIDAYIDEYIAWLAQATATNAYCVEQADRVNTYIVTTLGQSYPVEFNL